MHLQEATGYYKIGRALTGVRVSPSLKLLWLFFIEMKRQKRKIKHEIVYLNEEFNIPLN